MAVRKEIEQLSEYIIEMRRTFHSHPELSGKEYQTALRIEKELDKLQIPHFRVGETGVMGVIENPQNDLQASENQPAIVLRADMDALSITQKNEVPYKSQNSGVMHACGHDGHIAALLGAAQVIYRHKHELKKRVFLLFQQAEEIGAGAKQFIEGNLFKITDQIIGIHLASFLPTGKVSIQKGESNASCDYFKIIVKGRSCHVSKPHEGIDAVYITSQIVVGLQSIAARMTNPLDSVVVGIGKMTAGTNYNIIANEGVLEGTTRAFNNESRKKVNEAVSQIAKSIGETYGAEVEVIFKDYASPVINNREVAEEVIEVASHILGAENVMTNAPKTMMADDFAEFQQVMKGCYLFVGSSHNESTSYPHHHECFDIDERALLISADIFATYALTGIKSTVLKTVE